MLEIPLRPRVHVVFRVDLLGRETYLIIGVWFACYSVHSMLLLSMLNTYITGGQVGLEQSSL